MLELKVLVSIFMLTMSTFFHKYIVLLIGFCRVHNILLSVITMSLSDRVCQKHRPLVFLAGLLLVKEYATYVKFHTGSEI